MGAVPLPHRNGRRRESRARTAVDGRDRCRADDCRHAAAGPGVLAPAHDRRGRSERLLRDDPVPQRPTPNAQRRLATGTRRRTTGNWQPAPLTAGRGTGSISGAGRGTQEPQSSCLRVSVPPRRALLPYLRPLRCRRLATGNWKPATGNWRLATGNGHQLTAGSARRPVRAASVRRASRARASAPCRWGRSCGGPVRAADRRRCRPRRRDVWPPSRAA